MAEGLLWHSCPNRLLPRRPWRILGSPSVSGCGSHQGSSAPLCSSANLKRVALGTSGQHARQISCTSATADTAVAATEQVPARQQHQRELGSTALQWAGRSRLCGTIREEDVDQQITICGWVHRYRNFGGVVFADIRDQSGLLQLTPFIRQLLSERCSLAGFCAPAESRLCHLAQITSRPPEFPEAAEACQRLRNEWVVQVQGQVIKRSDPNPQIPTGQVELVPAEVTVLNTVGIKLPLLPSDDSTPKEETRLRNRVLDLRNDAGAFYALPQSPQLFKVTLQMTDPLIFPLLLIVELELLAEKAVTLPLRLEGWWHDT
ncbi:hypothetical protein MMC29_001313 [Sticta canariensis]|nr:hypothetical protein [Sticta canariensis]